MREGPLFYYITDRLAFPGDERTRRFHLLDKITEATSHGVDYIQLREKDLSSHALEGLAREAARIIREMKSQNRALRTGVAYEFQPNRRSFHFYAGLLHRF